MSPFLLVRFRRQNVSIMPLTKSHVRGEPLRRPTQAPNIRCVPFTLKTGLQVRFDFLVDLQRGKYLPEFGNGHPTMGDVGDAGLTIDVISSATISKAMFRDCFGIEPRKTEETWHGSKTIGITGYYKYRCAFDLPDDVEKFFYVVDRFCKMFEGDAHIGAEHLLRDLYNEFESYHKHLKVEHFAIGAWTGLSCFIEKFSSTRARSLKRMECTFFHDRQFLEIYFEDKISHEVGLNPVYKLRVAYKDIRKIVLKRELRHRDAFYGASRKKEPTEVFLLVNKISAFTWSRPDVDAYQEFFEGVWDRTPCFGALGGPSYCTSIGAATVLKFKLDINNSEQQQSDSVNALLVAAGVPVSFANVRTQEMPKNAQPLTCDKGSADVQCALACIHSLSPELSLRIALDQNNKELQNLLAKLAAEDDASLVAALYDIYYAIRDYPLVDMKSAVEDAFQRAKSGALCRTVVTKEKLPGNLYLVKKVTVCPSRIIIEPPTVVRVNVLLHDLDPERVMLVDIRDDDEKRIRLSNPDEARLFIQTSIAERVKRGIKHAGKTYFLLGNSRSQMEDFSFWAYAIDKKGTESISTVRQRLGIEGDLATRVAIQDMVFADALGCVEIDPEWVTEEDNVVPPAEDFKLGIGQISKDALGFILDNCYPSGYPCSAIRVIHGGRKGTLVYEPTLSGNRIVYRKSQTVFASEDRNLYLIGTNEIQEAVLDRVFISTLSSKLDGHQDVFAPKDFVSPVYELLIDLVEPFLRDKSKPQPPAEALLPHIFQRQSLRRYDQRGDGLFRQAIRCRQLKSVRDLRMLKERVKGAYELMPVVDEFGVLEEGEVFIQLAVRGADFNVLNSPVIISRKDAMHPGELLRVTAVDRPEVVSVLAHLSNCIVMPSKGRSRSLALLSRNASYAEGSNVIVIANTPDGPPKFLFKKNDKVPTTAVSLGPAVDPSCDIETHFFNFLQYASYNDFEEVFCALSDSLPQHAYSETCLRVGIQRRFLEEYRRGGRELYALPKIVCYPDFLEKISKNRTYCSARPLSHVFRRVKFLDVGYFESTELEYRDITFQPELDVTGSEAYESDAERDIVFFKKNLEGIASSYQISVDEVLTGTIFSLPESTFSAERVRSIEATVKIHVQHLATLCKRQFKRGMKKASEEAALQKVSAYYIASRRFPEAGGYAFPWMFPDLMQSLIKICKPKPPPIQRTKLISKLLEAVSAENEQRIKHALMTNIFAIFEIWFNTNKKIFAFTRTDTAYFSEKFTDCETTAFENAFCKFESAENGGGIVERLLDDPLPILAETLRQMMFVYAKASDGKFSAHQFSMMHIQTLLMNTLIRIAATGSLRVLLTPKKILRDIIVIHRMLLPLDIKDSKYIRTTHNDLMGFEENLRDCSLCERVKIRAVPAGEVGEGDYEEFIARGTWYAAANLEYVITQPDFRSTQFFLFDDNRRRLIGLRAPRE